MVNQSITNVFSNNVASVASSVRNLHSIIKMINIISNHFADIDRVLTPLDANHAALVGKLTELVDVISRIRHNVVGGRVYVCGNGGSASNAGHLVLHLRDVGIRAYDLVSDVPWLTATANDYGYDKVFSWVLEALQAGPEDLLIVISGSGNSPNIILALEYAGRKNIPCWGLLGMGGGKAAALCDGVVLVDSDSYAVVEDVHSIALHALTQALRQVSP